MNGCEKTTAPWRNKIKTHFRSSIGFISGTTQDCKFISLAFSIYSHSFWEFRKLRIKLTVVVGVQDIQFWVVSLFL
ncbi:hypothetical protein ACE6H2_006999 [Prunus campanulata]